MWSVSGRRSWSPVLKRFNPFRNTGAPALLSVVIGILCVVGGRYVWPLAVLPGVALCVVGTRIAYGHRGAADYVRWRRLVPGWGLGTSVEAHRQIEGGIIAIFGLFFLILAITGIVDLAG